MVGGNDVRGGHVIDSSPSVVTAPSVPLWCSLLFVGWVVLKWWVVCNERWWRVLSVFRCVVDCGMVVVSVVRLIIVLWCVVSYCVVGCVVVGLCNG